MRAPTSSRLKACSLALSLALSLAACGQGANEGDVAVQRSNLWMTTGNVKWAGAISVCFQSSVSTSLTKSL